MRVPGVFPRSPDAGGAEAYGGAMENTLKAPPSGDPPTLFWILVHGASEAIWMDIEGQSVPLVDEQAQVAYEALGILHAQAHAYLENAGHPYLVASCKIDRSNASAALILMLPGDEPER